MKKIIVLGAGMVGSAMALDLAGKYDVTAADIDKDALQRLSDRYSNIWTKVADLSDRSKLAQMVEPFDIVVNAVPGFMGFETLRTIIEAGKDVVDISFFPEDPLVLDALAREREVTAIMDCGVAPGMDNIILGYYNTQFEVDFFECLVGGLPKVRKWPFAYKAPFSPMDVIEEYTRPARYVENGHIITRPALTDPELVEFEGIGTLESFNTDGLRSIIDTMSHIPNMKEKTLRYPGHIEYMRVLRETGFFDKTPIEVNGERISPLDFTSKLLFKEWKLGETEEEFTVMRVTVAGKDSDTGKPRKVVYDLHDEYSTETRTSSMARTTGYTATAAVNMIFDGVFNEHGVFPPELVGKHEACFEYFLKYLAERKIEYRKREE